MAAITDVSSTMPAAAHIEAITTFSPCPNNRPKRFIRLPNMERGATIAFAGNIASLPVAPWKVAGRQIPLVRRPSVIRLSPDSRARLLQPA